MKSVFYFNLFMYLFFLSQGLLGQRLKSYSKGSVLKSFLKIKVGLESGVEWEQRVNKNSALDIGIGLNITRQSDDLYKTKAPLIFLPDAYGEYRNYFDFSNRIKRNKKTENNSADFYFGKIETFYAVKNQNYFGLLFIQGLGGQRFIFQRLGFDVHLGIIEHLYFDKPPYGSFNYLKIEPDLEFSISYAIN